MNQTQFKKRIACAGATVFIILLGLIWRSSWFNFSAFWSKYGGDAIWAMMIYSCLGIIHPDSQIKKRAGIAAGICLTVELSQLYHAPWINAIRDTPLGKLALGKIFNWPDIPAYLVGVGFAAIIHFKWQSFSSSPKAAALLKRQGDRS